MMMCSWMQCGRRALVYVTPQEGGTVVLPACSRHGKLLFAGFPQGEVVVRPLPRRREH